ERELPVPQPSQQVLANVRDLFQLVETQKSAGALDGVNGTKYASQRVPIGWFFLEADQVPVQPVQVLVTLDQKILDDVTVGVAHRRRSFRSWERLPAGEGPLVAICLPATLDACFVSMESAFISL